MARETLRSPRAPLTPCLLQGVEPIPEPIVRIAGQPLAGDFALPAPIDPFRKTKGFRALGTTSRAWRYASPPAPNHARNGWPSDHQSGERSCCPRYPHDHIMETNLPQIGCAPCHRDDFHPRPGREHFIAALTLEPSHRPRTPAVPVSWSCLAKLLHCKVLPGWLAVHVPVTVKAEVTTEQE